MIAHVAGVPVEETLLALLSAVGAGLLLARAREAGAASGIGQTSAEVDTSSGHLLSVMQR